MRPVVYTKEREGEWNAFVTNAKNSLFMFHRSYMDYHSDRFSDHSFMFYEDDELCGLLPANLSGNCLYSHQGLTFGGLLLSDKAKQHTAQDCFEALLSQLRSEGISKLVYKAVPHIYHRQPAEEDLYCLHRAGAVLSAVSASTVVNLSAPLKMPKGRKAQIARAKREGVEVRLLTEKEDYVRFMALEDKVLTERHDKKAVHSAEEMWLLHSRFPEEIRLFGAMLSGELIAGSVVFVYPQLVHTQYMAADETARRIGALDLVIAGLIEEYASQKLWLDFGISTEDDGHYLNEGLIAQKEGFGGRTNIYGKWELQL
ncbi:MAG: GNAT family N-acetyltransferase [Lachnospiraceae bacterium]|nr:GNAT family N-acetyltransferase [Lachnospiraceae bacterium]